MLRNLFLIFAITSFIGKFTKLVIENIFLPIKLQRIFALFTCKIEEYSKYGFMKMAGPCHGF